MLSLAVLMSTQIDEPNQPSGVLAVVSNVLSSVAAAGIFSLMALVFIGVFFRYFLNSPLAFRGDLMALLLGITIFTAVPGVTYNRRHITIDALTAVFARFPRFDRWRRIIIDIGVIAMTLYMSWLMFREATKAYDRETVTDTMEWQYFPFFTAHAVLIAISAVLFTSRALKERGRAADEHEGLSL